MSRFSVLVISFGLLGSLGAPDALAAPLWQRLLERKGSPRDHLRLAEGHAQAGRCGAAVFHFRMYLRKGTSPFLRTRVKERIARCLKQSGWGPPKRLAPTRRVLVLKTDSAAAVRVPGGGLRIGSSAGERNVARALCRLRLGATAAKRCQALRFSREQTPAPVRVAAFRILRTEVSWERYLRCVKAGSCRQPPAAYPVPRSRQRPVVGVTWKDAKAFCRWAGGRLPTEHEWVAAARGFQVPVRTWPWGRHAAARCARVKSAKVHAPAAVGTTPCDASRFGVLDLSGNVREWVATAKGGRSPRRGLKPVRGGSFRAAEWFARVAARELYRSDTRAADLGFRCVGVRSSRPRRKGQ